MAKTAFLTTIFPACEKYLPDFFTSLQNQTFKDFDIVVVIENVDKSQIKDLCTSEMTVKVVNSTQASAVGNRIQGLQYIVENGYNIVVFGDCDDTFSTNRVEESLKTLETADIAVNELMLVDENLTLLHNNYLSQRLENNQRLDADFIKDKNVFGLSNTALRTNILPEFDEIPDVIAFDWYLYAEILENSEISTRFTDQCFTNYRQHEQNITGMNNLDESYILRGVQVKLSQYKQLSQKFPKYNKMYTEFKKLSKRIAQNLDFRAKYIDKIKQKDFITPLWWEEIKLLEDL